MAYCVCLQWVGPCPAPSTLLLRFRKLKQSLVFFSTGHFLSSLMNVFIGYVMRTSYGWLVKLFNFINLG